MKFLHYYAPSANACNKLATAALLLALGGGLAVSPAHAQAPDRREIRTYIPPDQLVSFSPSTPFNTFIDFVNPIFERVTGKSVVDPVARTQAIGVNITRMHFLDALEQVLSANGLWYRENEQYFVITTAPTAPGEDGVAAGGPSVLPATIDSREIRINALLFQVNVTKAREVGIDWSVIFGGGGGGGGGGGVGGEAGGRGGGAGGGGGIPIGIRTDEFFDRLPRAEDLITPDVIQLGTLTRLFRLLETDGIGRTIANPSVTVMSGEQGNIQIGADVPVVVRDFAGNSVVQFYSTGIIIDVTPTLISQPAVDTSRAPMIDFVHLDVSVQNSNSSPSPSGAPVIAKTVATTQALLLDGEQTIIGGLYTTDQVTSRQGIPILKDLPWWVFGLRYIFGFTTTSDIQNELLIVLQAEVMDSLPERAARPLEYNLLERRRQEIQRVIRSLSSKDLIDDELPTEQYDQ